jgi:hypothetical protein
MGAARPDRKVKMVKKGSSYSVDWSNLHSWLTENVVSPVFEDEQDRARRQAYEADYLKRKGKKTFDSYDAIYSIISPEEARITKRIYDEHNKKHSTSPKKSEVAIARKGPIPTVKTGETKVVGNGPVEKSTYGHLKQMARKNEKPSKRSPKLKTAAAPVSRSVVLPRSAYAYNGSGVLRVRHREYVGDVSSSGTSFNSSQFCVMNPGDPASFPWLAPIAASFERFRVINLRFMYIPTCSTTTAGSVILAFDTNAQRTPPSTKVAMLEYEDSCRGAPWLETSLIAHPPKEKLYTLYGNNYSASSLIGSISSTVDIKTYAAGQLLVGCDGVAQATVGEVHLEYEIELTDPGIYRNPSVFLQMTATPSGAHPFPSSGAIVYSNQNYAVSSAGSIVTLTDCPPGGYNLLLRAYCSAVQTGLSVTIAGNGTSILGQNWNSSTGTVVEYCNFLVTVPTQVEIIFNGFTNLQTSSVLMITPYDPSLGGFI